MSNQISDNRKTRQVIADVINGSAEANTQDTLRGLGETDRSREATFCPYSMEGGAAYKCRASLKLLESLNSPMAAKKKQTTWFMSSNVESRNYPASPVYSLQGAFNISRSRGMPRHGCAFTERSVGYNERWLSNYPSHS